MNAVLVTLGFLASAAAMAVSATDPVSAAPAPDATRVPGAISNRAVADFNGDLQPDVVTVRRNPSKLGGGFHHVSITLSGRSPTTFSLETDETLLEVSPLDVDGDGDADLLLVRALTDEPVALWLNDGSGTFLETQPDEYRGHVFRVQRERIAKNSGERALNGPGSFRQALAVSRAVTRVTFPPMAGVAPSASLHAPFGVNSSTAGPRAPPLSAFES